MSTMEPSVVDGVHRQPPTGISVLIVGAGVGGLMAALECWRQGHTVRLVERDAAPSPAGDCIGLFAQAMSTIKHYPTLVQGFGRYTYDAQLSFYHYGGKPITPSGPMPWNMPGAPNPALPVRVPAIHSRTALCALLDAQRRRLGIEASFGQRVVAYGESEDKAWVRTDIGDTFDADVVIAADGVGTGSDRHITGGKKLKAISSGYACYRGMIPRALVEKMSPDTRAKLLGPGIEEFRIYISRDMHCNIIVTADFVCFVLTHKDEHNASETWNRPATREVVLETLRSVPGWDPAIIELCSALPVEATASTFSLPNLNHELEVLAAARELQNKEPAAVHAENEKLKSTRPLAVITPGVIDYNLIFRSPDPRWASPGGRVLQLGDAAHSFLPTSGSGAGAAMEDGISLAVCLRLGGKQRVQESTKSHVALRYERVSTLQHFGLSNRQHMHHLDVDAVVANPELLRMPMSRWIWSFDVQRYTEDNFHAALRHVVDGEPFTNTNLPPGHKYSPWTIEELLAAESRGQLSTLKDTGDWE